MRNIKLTIQYDGSRYKGWQRLGDQDKTIQAKIENVLSKMTGENIELIGAGRTDAGVHALNQIANFQTECALSPEEILDYCYRYLPDDIVITKAEEVDALFHARYHAKERTYVYKIWNDKIHDPFDRKYITHVPEPLDIQKMKDGAAYLVGEHDFTSFTNAKSKKKSMTKIIYSMDIHKEGNLVQITVKASGFLHNMMRAMVGTLIEVGLGRLDAQSIQNIIDKRDRAAAGPTAPSKGLFLKEVKYK